MEVGEKYMFILLYGAGLVFLLGHGYPTADKADQGALNENSEVVESSHPVPHDTAGHSNTGLTDDRNNHDGKSGRYYVSTGSRIAWRSDEMRMKLTVNYLNPRNVMQTIRREAQAQGDDASQIALHHTTSQDGKIYSAYLQGAVKNPVARQYNPAGQSTIKTDRQDSRGHPVTLVTGDTKATAYPSDRATERSASNRKRANNTVPGSVNSPFNERTTAEHGPINRVANPLIRILSSNISHSQYRGSNVVSSPISDGNLRDENNTRALPSTTLALNSQGTVSQNKGRGSIEKLLLESNAGENAISSDSVPTSKEAVIRKFRSALRVPRSPESRAQHGSNPDLNPINHNFTADDGIWNSTAQGWNGDNETAGVGLKYRSYVDSLRDSWGSSADNPKVDTSSVAVPEMPLYNVSSTGGIDQELREGKAVLDPVISSSDPEPEPEPEAQFNQTRLESPNSTSEPESHVGAEPHNGGDSGANSEVVPEGESESHGEPTSEPGCDPCLAEPTPDWDKAKPLWGAAWEFHIYFMGICFALLAAYSLISLVLLWRTKNLLSQKYFIALNSMLLFMGIIRALYFFIDAYNSQEVFPIIGAYFLYNLGFPCMTSAFSILFLALLNTVKMQVMSPKVQKANYLIGIIAFQFTLSVLTDVLVGLFYSVRILLFVCQVVFLAWGLFLFVGYLYIFRKLYRSIARTQMESYQITFSRSTVRGSSPMSPSAKKRPRVVLTVALNVTLATSVLGLASACLQIYGMIGVFNVFTLAEPEPWPWWAFHFCMRLAELGMCSTMSYVATQPLRYEANRKGKAEGSATDCTSVLMFLPCQRFCERAMSGGDENDSAWNISAPTASFNNHHAVMPNGTGNPTLAFSSPDTENPTMSWPEQMSDHAVGTGRRPPSMLINDNGYLRFRQDHEDPEGEAIGSTDDELDASDGGILQALTDGGYLEGVEVSSAVGAYCNPAQVVGITEARPGDSAADYWASPAQQRYSEFTRRRAGTTGFSTPATPRSFASTDLDLQSGMFSFKPPSSIHLRESIDRALNYPHFYLRTPDLLDTPDSLSLPKTPDYLKGSISSYSTLGTTMTKSTKPLSRRHSTSTFQSFQTPSLSMSDLRNYWLSKYYWDSRRSKNSSRSSTVGYTNVPSGGAAEDNVADDRSMMSIPGKTNLYRSHSDSTCSGRYCPDQDSW